MKTKVCSKCAKRRAVTSFYGKHRQCKACFLEWMERYRRDNPEKRRATVKQSNRKRLAAKRAWVRANWDKLTRWRKRDERRYPGKYRAHYTLTNAIRDGRLVRPATCEHCGARRKVAGHHPDYRRPLHIQWLCVPCHEEVHHTH